MSLYRDVVVVVLLLRRLLLLFVLVFAVEYYGFADFK